MKPTELMLGDFVYKPTPNGPVPIRIEQVWQIEKCEEEGYTPIPLTQKILEFNGFAKCENCDDDEKEDIEIQVNYGDYERWCEDGYLVMGEGNNIKYVHELQHAMRLCCIKEEIELW